jgi:hypothetical protein
MEIEGRTLLIPNSIVSVTCRTSVSTSVLNITLDSNIDTAFFGTVLHAANTSPGTADLLLVLLETQFHFVHN